MLDSIIPIIVSFLPVWIEYLIPLFALAFIATVPCIIRGVISYYGGC